MKYSCWGPSQITAAKVKISGAEARIFRGIRSILSIDRSSAAKVLAVYNKQLFVLHEEPFQLTALSQCPEMIWDANTYLCLIKTIQQVKG